MSRLAEKISQAAAIEDAIESRAKAAGARGLELVSTNLPKVADATDRLSKAVAEFVTSSSRSVADKLRGEEPNPIAGMGAAIGASWLVRRAGRLAMRNPTAVLLGGAAIAAIGVTAWWLTRPAAEPESMPA